MKKFLQYKNSKLFNFLCYLWVGIFCYLAFMPYNFSVLTFIAPFGLFFLRYKYKNNYKKLFIQGIIAGCFITFFSYYWLNYLFMIFGGFPLPIAIILFVLYSIATNTRYGIYLIAFELMRKHTKMYSPILASFSIIFAEFFSFQIFPYYFGNLVAGDIYLSQNIEYIGIYGLSGIVFFISYFIFKILINYKLIINKKYSLLMIKFSILPIAILIFSYLFGYYLKYKWENYPIYSNKKIIMIQPNAPLEFRDGRSITKTLDDLMMSIEDLAIKGGEGVNPDLIVLPESGVPFFSANNIRATNIFHRTYNERFEILIYLLANRFKTNVFFNELDATFLNDEIKRDNQRFYNSSTLYDPNGIRRDNYQKSYLLAFGEYIPFGEIFPILYNILPQVGHFLQGNKLNLISYYENLSPPIPLNKSHLRWIDSSFMNLNSIKDYYNVYKSDTSESGKFLPLICYEVIIPEFVRKFKDSGNPDFIVNITNDKWYGPSVESFQHLELARIRSIEFRRWMVRSTNSGTSVFIDHLGRILNNNYTPQEKATVVSAQIDVIRSEPTFYVKYGDLLSWLYLILVSFYGLKLKYFRV